MHKKKASISKGKILDNLALFFNNTFTVPYITLLSKDLQNTYLGVEYIVGDPCRCSDPLVILLFSIESLWC